jgi:hypothetical protein
MLRIKPAATLLPIFVAAALSAQSNIEFDKKEFDVGKVYEGTTKKVAAVFTIKNSGDSTLIFTEVLPGCGCTAVKFDSAISPGSSSRLTAEIDIAGFRSGLLSKAVTVVSNAPNDSIVRLLIKGSIIAPVDPSTTFIEMADDRPYLLQLTTGKADLGVTAVTFTPFKENPDAPAKKTISVKYALHALDSARTDGLTSFILEMSSFAVDSTTAGAFAIFTNHPDKKEMRIRGKVVK